MRDIIPAVLPKNFDELSSRLHALRGIAPIVQIDVVDGVFAHSTTWPYHDTERFERMCSGEEGLPEWEAFDFEFDLMIKDPREAVVSYVQVGASRVVLHIESEGLREALAKLHEAREAQDFKVAVGLALPSSASPEILRTYEGQFDYIQVMGIEKVGFQGQPFDPRAIELVSKLRAQYPEMPIQVDGAVSLETAPVLAKAGASRLVVGSYILDADNPSDAYKAVYTEVNA